ncbi:hypothetical protein AA101099_0417 [Neoasaia chiangmaiensis NBRC 101099]|nr:hypothetical protein AA101099_0417 [Neoasaia chiangmaiensis NBRC 101099]
MNGGRMAGKTRQFMPIEIYDRHVRAIPERIQAGIVAAAYKKASAVRRPGGIEYRRVRDGKRMRSATIKRDEKQPGALLPGCRTSTGSRGVIFTRYQDQERFSIRCPTE